jgi:hypothetical protein
VSEGYDLALEEWLGVLAELWTAAGKPLETDRLEVYGQSLGEVPLGLLEMASSVTRVAETADGGLPHWGATLRPPRLVAVEVGGTVGCAAGDGGVGGEEMG